ncbi:hypothetical protein A5N15_08755 [Rothia kristinae]|uniref:Uncharacterized protein n=1 Tax=Rothia kristinae TaxID=37923 RepID=A0A657IU17_9MICC|nr:hypothetical protein A5N15_08755 [Rothia kristinae]
MQHPGGVRAQDEPPPFHELHFAFALLVDRRVGGPEVEVLGATIHLEGHPLLLPRHIQPPPSSPGAHRQLEHRTGHPVPHQLGPRLGFQHGLGGRIGGVEHRLRPGAVTGSAPGQQLVSELTGQSPVQRLIGQHQTVGERQAQQRLHEGHRRGDGVHTVSIHVGAGLCVRILVGRHIGGVVARARASRHVQARGQSHEGEPVQQEGRIMGEDRRTGECGRAGQREGQVVGDAALPRGQPPPQIGIDARTGLSRMSRPVRSTS